MKPEDVAYKAPEQVCPARDQHWSVWTRCCICGWKPEPRGLRFHNNNVPERTENQNRQEDKQHDSPPRKEG